MPSNGKLSADQAAMLGFKDEEIENNINFDNYEETSQRTNRKDPVFEEVYRLFGERDIGTIKKAPEYETNYAKKQQCNEKQ
jgi:hypothetical protein